MFQYVVLMLGNSKRIGDAGIRDTMVQSNVIAQVSIDKALTGHMYNRAVRMQKLTYKALMRILVTDRCIWNVARMLFHGHFPMTDSTMQDTYSFICLTC